MYRAVALAWLRSGKTLDEENLKEILDSVELEIRFENGEQKILLNGEDVSEKIREPRVSEAASPISAFASVRKKLVALQREIGADGGVVMDGRDIGSFVFPDAELKIFLTASPKTRAKRRALELRSKGIDADENEILKQIQKRDARDSSRAISPLKKADDAVEIDTSKLTVEEQVEKVASLARKIIDAQNEN